MRAKIAYFLLLAAVVLAGCNWGSSGKSKTRSRQVDGSLDRDTAAEMISKHFEGAPTTSVTVYFSGDPSVQLETDQQVASLYRAGYIGIETMSDEYHIGPFSIFVLSEKGKQQAARDDWKIKYDRLNRWIDKITIPVARPELVEVTGITKQGTEATVIFMWRQKPIGEVGEALGYGQEKQRQMHFRKFDDGWRLVRF